MSSQENRVDTYFKDDVNSINTLLMSLVAEQIKQAFIQSKKEVSNLHGCISKGIREAKKNGTKMDYLKEQNLEKLNS